MGKVGSRAIDLGLERANVKSWHIHTMAPNLIQWHLTRAYERGTLPPGHVCTSTYLMQRNLKNPTYISCVRDPVARNLSAFFQNITDYVKDPANANPQYVLDAFTAEYDHDIPLTWFDREWHEYLGIDIYQAKPASGRRFLQADNWMVFKPNAGPAFISKVLSKVAKRRIKITLSNVSDRKAHAALYKAIKERARLESALADRIYGSPFARQFWSETERLKMHRQWTEVDLAA